MRKILGAPDTKNGTEVVKHLLKEWNVKNKLCGMVIPLAQTVGQKLEHINA